MTTITPGPLPENNTRIKVSAVLTAFVNGTTVNGFTLTDFATSPFTMVYTATDPPSSDDMQNGLMWFKRGEGAMYQLITRLEAVDETNTSSEALWVKIADGRQIVARCLTSLPVSSEPMWWSTDFSEYRAIQHVDTALSPVMDITSDTNTNARTVLHDPVLISANTGVSDTTKGVTTHGYPTVAWEYGFCTAKVVGNGPVVYMSSLFSDIDAYGAAVLIATSASLSGATLTEVGVLSQSDSTDGLREAVIFKRPQISNALHGDLTV